MLSKSILYNKDAREKLKAGVDKLANAVKVTLGAKGRNVIIDKNWREPYATKDGVTVAEEIFLEDPQENVGAQILRGAARKTAIDAGDGTTTATILAQQIINRGMDAIDTGANPIEIKNGIEAAVKQVVAAIKEQAIPVTTEEQILQVATIAGNNDPEIGALVADAIKQVGRDGIITINPANSTKTTTTISTGLKFSPGFASPHFINNPGKRTCEWRDPYILICEKKITSVKDIMPILEAVLKTGKPIVLMADSFDDTVMGSLVINWKEKKFPFCAVHLPGQGDLRKEYLLDLEAVTGATIMGPERQTFKLDRTEIHHLGTVSKITIDQNSTTLIGNDDRKEAIEARVAQLKLQVADADNQQLKDHLNERIAKLTTGIAVVNVGGTTDIEIRERRDRIDDSIRATQSALAEGVVPGGGACLIHIYSAFDRINAHVGESVLYRSLMAPFEQGLLNAGIVDPRQIYVNIIAKEDTKWGYNVLTEDFGDMFFMGIIDPAKVVRCALENAASVAIMILNSECLLVEEKAPQ